MDPIILALGSNQGDRHAALNRACLLLERQGIQVLRRSKLYTTRPLQMLRSESLQPWYMNAAIEVETKLSPMELLARCRAVEREMGRVRRARWDPRVIDIDLIFYGRQKVDYSELKLPHPEWRSRDFVLAPLVDLEVSPPGYPIARARGLLLEDLGAAEKHIESSRRWDV